VFCQGLFAKCFVDTQFVANIMFTGKAGITREGIVKFVYSCLGGWQSPHHHGIKTSTSIVHQCLGGHLRWPTLRTNCLT
jgi:hypothetical protein